MSTRMKTVASVLGIILWAIVANVLIWTSPGPEVTLTGLPARIYLIVCISFMVGSMYFAYWVVKEEINRRVSIKMEEKNEDRI